MLVKHLLLGPLIVLVACVTAAFFVVRDHSTAKRKAQLVLSSIGEPDVLNPIISSSASASEVQQFIFNALLGSDEHLNVTGELAEDYRVTQKSTAFFAADATATAAEAKLRSAKDAWPEMHLASCAREGSELILHFADPDKKVVGGTGYEDRLFEIIDRDRLLPVCVVTVTHDPDKVMTGGDKADSAGVTRRLTDLAERVEGVKLHEIFPLNESMISVSVVGRREAFREAVPDALACPADGDDEAAPAGQVMEHLDQPLLNEPTITFRLRRDVKWQDGEPFTAADAAFTYQCTADPQYRSPRAGDFWPIKRVDVPDEYTFVVEYRTPYGDLVHTWQKTQLIPRHILHGKSPQWWADNYNSNPVGTGPFRVVEWKRNEYVKLAANEDYFEGPPNLPAVVYRILPDPFVNQVAFDSGTFDAYKLAPYQVKRYEAQTDRYDLFRKWGLGYVYIGWNQANPLFADRTVRVALAHAINTQRMIDYVYHGWARPSKGTFPAEMWYANKDIQPYSFDQAKARSMLAEAGWADTDGDGWLDKGGKRFEFTLITNHGNTMRALIQQLVQDDLKQIGIKVDTAMYEWAVFLENYLDTRQFDACLLGWGLYYNYDLYGIWHSSQRKSPGQNNCNYSNAEVDRLLEKVRTTFDRAEITHLCGRIQELIYRDQPYLFLLEAKATEALYGNRYFVRRPDAEGEWIDEPVRETKQGYSFYVKWWAPQSARPAMVP